MYVHWMAVNCFVILCLRHGKKKKSPNGTLAPWIHWRTDGTLVGCSKFWRIGERTEYSDRSRRVNRWTNLGERIFRPHRTAPDLSVVEEKQLIVAHFHSFVSKINKKYKYSPILTLKNQNKQGSGRWTETFHVQSCRGNWINALWSHWKQYDGNKVERVSKGLTNGVITRSKAEAET